MEVDMDTRRPLLLLPSLLLAGAGSASCVTTTSSDTGSTQSSLGCPEFQPGATLDPNLKIDPRVRAFAQASADLAGVAAELKTTIKTACVGIASDLGVPDSWSAMGDSDDAISNSSGTGACDAARARIDAIMDAHPEANFALLVSQGECHVDFDAEARCEEGCATQTQCTPGTVETRCDPGQLSVVCSANCAAQAYCEGQPDLVANCQGQCEAECTGQCTGSCTDETGRRTDDDPSCHGKCKGHCSGQCTGRCQIDVQGGIQCGTNVSCKGGCTGQYTQPVCETECTPPKCTIDSSCFESCRATAAENLRCAPPTVLLFCNTGASPDVAKLAATINKNLAALVQFADTHGNVVFAEVQNLSVSGKAVLDASGDLDLKSVSCATAAAEALTKVAGTLQVSTTASAGVATDCSSRAN
jgi:hypothetical protein